MFKKNLAFLLVLFSVVFVFNSAARAQETEAATTSSLTGVALPAGAQRVLPESMPASITEGFDKVIPADGSFTRGELEALVWMGGDYKQANAPALVSQLTGALKNGGWKYAVEREENGVTVFSAVKEGAKRRAVIGYYGANKEALVLAWTELLPAGGAQNQPTDDAEKPVTTNTARSTNVGGSILGKWSNGSMSLWSGFSPVTGPKSYTPGKSHVFTYTFHPNGTFEFAGLMTFNQYNCSTSYFQDKRGRYTIDGNRLTLTLTKNFWRQTDTCIASSNREINHKLDPEVYTYSVERTGNGKVQICLESDGTKPCYERGE